MTKTLLPIVVLSSCLRLGACKQNQTEATNSSSAPSAQAALADATASQAASAAANNSSQAAQTSAPAAFSIESIPLASNFQGTFPYFKLPEGYKFADPYASGSGKRQLRTLNKQLEDILVRKKDMESLLQHLYTRYSIAYVVNLRADTQRPVVVPGYVQKMLDKHGGSFHEMLLDYCDKLVAPAYRDGFRMLFDYDYVRDRICREGAIRYAYVRNDGERFLITIFPDTHSVDEVMWVFAKEDTSSEE